MARGRAKAALVAQLVRKTLETNRKASRAGVCGKSRAGHGFRGAGRAAAFSATFMARVELAPFPVAAFLL